MPSKRVLLTGASNLIGSHILDQLLSFNDVAVRAVVASRDEALGLRQQYPSTSHPLLDFAIVAQKDIAIPRAYNLGPTETYEPFDTVIHIVPPDPSEEADCLSRFINLETGALINFLRNVQDIAPGVRRVVIITSLTSFARWLVDPRLERNPRNANGSPARVPVIDSDYVLATSRASDNIVCDAIWKWSSENRVGFELISFAAPSIYGPSIRPLSNSSDLEDSNRRIWNICSNNSSELVTSPPYGIDYYTDVRDLAFAIVQAAFVPEARNRRFLVSAGIMPPGSDIAEFLRNRFPEFSSRIHPDNSPPRRTSSEDPPIDFTDTHPAAAILGLVRYRKVEDTLTDLARQIVELHRRKEWRRVIQS